MSEAGPRLSTSAFIADLSPQERSVWRFLAGLAGGLGAGLAAGLVVGLVTILVFAAGAGLMGPDITGFPLRLQAMLDPASASLTSSLLLMLLAVTTNGPLALTFVVIAALIVQRPVLRYVTVAPRPRWRMLVAGLLFAAMVLGPLVAAQALLDPHAPRPPVLSLAPDTASRLAYAVAAIALLIPAAAAEELVFRGWLLRQSAALTRNPVALMAINGVLFSAVHGEFSPGAFLTRALMGAGFVYMTLRLGGIEFSTGAHAANNIMIVLFLQPLTRAPTPTSGVDLDAVLQDGFLFTSYVVMAEVTARWAPLRRWTGADQAARRPTIAEEEHFA
jgi:membrane protease YdiL (CAAX protease family)